MSSPSSSATRAPASRTHTVAAEAARLIAKHVGIDSDPEIIDLTAIAPLLLAAEPSAAVEIALDQVAGADLVLVASPTYKATYTGLLKVCSSTAAARRAGPYGRVAAAGDGAPRHALAVEVHLRPLLVELGATAPTPGLALLEAEIGRTEVLTNWAEQIVLAVPTRRGAFGLGEAPDPTEGEVEQQHGERDEHTGLDVLE